MRGVATRSSGQCPNAIGSAWLTFIWIITCASLEFEVMATDAEKFAVEVSEGNSVTALLYTAPKRDRTGVTLILGHGAGANQLHPFMRLFASGLADRGFDVVTFNFLYMERGRGAPDQKAKLESCYTAVIKAAQGHKKLTANRLIIG